MNQKESPEDNPEFGTSFGSKKKGAMSYGNGWGIMWQWGSIA